MGKIYLVYEDTDVDGGFGDAVETKNVVAVFRNKEKAHEYIKKNDNPHIYDRPYNDLYTGGLHIEEANLI
ncbi:hypothetical protein QMA56_05005 [Leuconostoc falkenbergense]|uniref:DUF7336 domain-containing protein n=1 Tax=Leuconostoc falkenbergense TaxID=2766470 RepID=UPI0024ADDA6A|nr:hypothetical protein [Leuconostoc falkenbergense]MDI6667068.1 hypothetical protein [Leuconostoc falkenbergense]